MEWIALLATLFAGYLGMLLDVYAGLPSAGAVLAVGVMGFFLMKNNHKNDQ